MLENLQCVGSIRLRNPSFTFFTGDQISDVSTALYLRDSLLNHCYLALGSNLQSPERQLRNAIAKLRRGPATSLLATAKFYRNPAQGRRAQPVFHNTVVLIKTRLSPQRLLKYCHRIEKSQGRTRSVRWGSRTLDIDIILYRFLKIETKQLQIPHPRYHIRDFVLVPLREIVKPSLLAEVTRSMNQHMKAMEEQKERPEAAREPGEL